jgi:hypothetical protein
MCRGYIKRGSIYHTEKNFIGSGYQDAYSAESNITAFKREADERGTPYVEVGQEVVDYVAAQSDPCIKEMFARMVKRDGEVAVLFPFKRLAHSFMVAGFGVQFDPEKERETNNRLRQGITAMKERIWSFVDRENAGAAVKAAHYVTALDEQLNVCNQTDAAIDKLEQLGFGPESPKK